MSRLLTWDSRCAVCCSLLSFFTGNVSTRWREREKHEQHSTPSWCFFCVCFVLFSLTFHSIEKEQRQRTKEGIRNKEASVKIRCYMRFVFLPSNVSKLPQLRFTVGQPLRLSPKWTVPKDWTKEGQMESLFST